MSEDVKRYVTEQTGELLTLVPESAYDTLSASLKESERRLEEVRGELGQLQRTAKFMEDSYLAEHEHWGKCKWKEEISRLRGELQAARNAASMCDDIGLDQPLAEIIHDVQADRERLYDNVQRLRASLAPDRCTYCGVPILGSFVSSVDGRMHPDCYYAHTKKENSNE